MRNLRIDIRKFPVQPRKLNHQQQQGKKKIITSEATPPWPLNRKKT